MIKRVVLLCWCLVALSACGSKDATSPETALGVYALQTISNQPLPYTFPGSPAGFAKTVSSAFFKIEANGVWKHTQNGTNQSGGATSQYTSDVAGTFTQSGNTFAFTYLEGSTPTTLSGTLNGTKLTVIIDAEAWVYSK